MAAGNVHRGYTGPTAYQPASPVLMDSKAATEHRRRDGFGLLISGALAIGFAAIMLSPLWLTGRHSNPESGVILGEAVSQPLTIPVYVTTPNQKFQPQVQPQSGNVTEALARAAARDAMSMTYSSRGSGIYLENFYGYLNHRGGRWIVSVNGLELIDLSAVELLQGDQVYANWEPA